MATNGLFMISMGKQDWSKAAWEAVWTLKIFSPNCSAVEADFSAAAVSFLDRGHPHQLTSFRQPKYWSSPRQRPRSPNLRLLRRPVQGKSPETRTLESCRLQNVRGPRWKEGCG